MSWFTSDKGAQQPHCPRCRKPEFVRLVKTSGDFMVWDCKRCGEINNERKKS